MSEGNSFTFTHACVLRVAKGQSAPDPKPSKAGMHMHHGQPSYLHSCSDSCDWRQVLETCTPEEDGGLLTKPQEDMMEV